MDPFLDPTSTEPGSRGIVDACHRVFECPSHGMLVAGPDGKLLRASGPLEDMVGYAHGTLSGPRTASLLPRRLRRAHLEVNAGLSAPHADRAWGAEVSGAGLEPKHLELELTDGVLMLNTGASVATLQSLSAMGVSIAVDDFGTGYSSLSYLRRFPIDVLKIDKTFVQDLGTGVGDSAIVRAIIALGTSLDYRVIAEGVETPQQLALLHAQHCCEGQGFLLRGPLAADALTTLLRTP